MPLELNGEAKRDIIYGHLEGALKVAIAKYYSEEIDDSQRLGWGRLVLQFLHEISVLVKDDIMEKNREDIENLKAVFRLKGVDL